MRQERAQRLPPSQARNLHWCFCSWSAQRRAEGARAPEGQRATGQTLGRKPIAKTRSLFTLLDFITVWIILSLHSRLAPAPCRTYWCSDECPELPVILSITSTGEPQSFVWSLLRNYNMHKAENIQIIWKSDFTRLDRFIFFKQDLGSEYLIWTSLNPVITWHNQYRISIVRETLILMKLAQNMCDRGLDKVLKFENAPSSNVLATPSFIMSNSLSASLQSSKIWIITIQIFQDI